MSDTKVCIGCGKVKPMNAFTPDATSKDGRMWNCDVCLGARPRTCAGCLKTKDDKDFEAPNARKCFRCQAAERSPRENILPHTADTAACLHYVLRQMA